MRALDNRQRYINIERTLFELTSDDFTVRVVEKPEDVKELLDASFEWVGQKDNLIFLRKRKRTKHKDFSNTNTQITKIAAGVRFSRSEGDVSSLSFFIYLVFNS